MKDLKPTETTTASEKPGFFKRIIGKLDESMKAKAEEKSQSSCCGGDKGKGGKCC